MDKEKETCCGNCLYYNGDMTDGAAFCDDREEFVQCHYYCYRYKDREEYYEV